jgi:hypothetical protein
MNFGHGIDKLISTLNSNQSSSHVHSIVQGQIRPVASPLLNSESMLIKQVDPGSVSLSILSWQV